MGYEIETANVQDYYANLLILQYRNKPKARNTIKLGAGIYLADGLIFELNDILDLETQQGAQLDLIGQILGCNRVIPGFDNGGAWFTFEKTGAYGYSDVNELSEGYWKQYRNSIASSYALEDPDYRLLLKFKAAYNIRVGSWGELDNLYYRFFGDEVRIVNTRDLSISYEVKSSLTTAFKAAQHLGYIKPPMAIGYSNLSGKNYEKWRYFSSGLGSKDWKGLAYNGEKYVALSWTGYVSTSQDAQTWSSPIQISNLTGYEWQCLAYGNSKFVAIDDGGNVTTSLDGETWENPVYIANLSSYDWRALAYDGAKFVALGEYGYISTSTDGITWTAKVKVDNLGARLYYALAYGNGKFVALDSNGYVSTSSDGTNWEVAIQNANLGSHNWSALTTNGIKFVALGNGYLSTSSDGINWAQATVSGLGAMNVADAVYNGKQFIALGGGGGIEYTL